MGKRSGHLSKFKVLKVEGYENSILPYQKLEIRN